MDTLVFTPAALLEILSMIDELNEYLYDDEDVA